MLSVRLCPSLTLLLTLCISCGSGSSSRASGSDARVPLPEGDAHFEVSFAGATEPVGRLLGWNLGRGTYYAPAGATVHPEWRKPERVSAIRRLAGVTAAEGAPPTVRFSGLQIDGSLGNDGYHFWDFVRPDHQPAPSDNMSVEDFAAIASEMSSELTVTVNFGSGTSAEAARYANYLNGNDATTLEVSARAQNGRTAPYGVRTFEIGNEVYGFWNTGNSAASPYSYANPSSQNGGDPAWFGKPSSSAADYAARALEYVHAIQAVSPGARFRVPLSQASMDSWGGLDASISAIEPLLREPAVESVVIHFYETDDAKTLGVTDINAQELMLAGSDLFRPLFADLRARLDAIARTPRLGIAVTEYHVGSGLSHATFQLGKTAAVGLSLADTLVLFAEAGIDHALQHLSIPFEASEDALVEDWYNPFRLDAGGALRDMPSYTVTRLFAEHLMSRRAQVTAMRVPRSAAPLPTGTEPYDLVHATAFASADGKTGTVFFTQRDAESPWTATFDVDDGYSVASARTWAPDAVDEDATSTEIAVKDLAFEQQGRRVRVVAPAHAVVAIRMERQ